MKKHIGIPTYPYTPLYKLMHHDARKNFPRAIFATTHGREEGSGSLPTCLPLTDLSVTPSHFFLFQPWVTIFIEM